MKLAILIQYFKGNKIRRWSSPTYQVHSEDTHKGGMEGRREKARYLEDLA